MREEPNAQVDNFLQEDVASIHHPKKGGYISIPEMLTAAAGFEERLRGFVGVSTEVIGISVWMDLGQKIKTVN